MTSTDHDELDIEALRARYDAERQQRLRDDGSAQYVAMDGRFESYLDDPWVTAPAQRAPLEETGYIPQRKYARAPEIFEHCQRIGHQFGLYERALFQTVVVDMHWHDDAAHWLVNTDRGDTIRARFVVLAGGPLNRPKLPGIPGIESFQGHS